MKHRNESISAAGRLRRALRLSWRAAGRGMGDVLVACNSCHDEFGQTVFFEPPHRSGRQPVAGWVTGPGAPAVTTPARGTATTDA